MTKRVIPILLIIFSTFTSHIFCQKNQVDNIDTSLLMLDTARINKIKYTGFLKEGIFYLINTHNDTLIKQGDFYFSWEFKDFNRDGHKDVLLHHSSNTPYVLDLFIFLPAINRFKKVKDFDNFPAPELIKGTKYYYSYHKSGCADLNWDSDLFFIQNFKAIRVGNISGRQCGNRNGITDAIYINKVRGDKKSLFKKLSIETINKYEQFKWGFIKEYWTKNYKLFI